MPRFNYIARDAKGGRIEGSLETDDRQAVVTRLQTMGYFPVKIEDVTPKGEGLRLGGLRRKVRTADLVNFNRQMADLVGAGVPLVKSLAIMLVQSRDPLMREIITDISKAVQGGDTLARALQRHPKVFNPLNVALVRAGETGGMLPDVLQRLADFSEAEEELKGKVLASLAYPCVMVLVGSVIITILITVVLPKITGVYKDLGQGLPMVTQILLAASGILARTWWIVLIAVFIGVASLRRFVATREGRLLYDRVILRIPILGDVVHKRELARFGRTLGSLLTNGVPILQAIEITTEVLSNSVMRAEVEKLPPAISQGANMASTLADSPVFPAPMVSMIAVGEETAQLDKVLVKTSLTYEKQVDRALKTLTSLLEPAIILALGVVVAFIVIAMLLPIMSLDPTEMME